MYDRTSGNLMVVDFERSEFCARQPLGLISPNGRNRKRKHGVMQKHGLDDYTRELQFVVNGVSRCVR